MEGIQRALSTAGEAADRAQAAYESFEPAATKSKKVREACDAALAALATQDWDAVGSAEERGKAFLLRGRVLDLKPEHSPEAEAALTRAVKLLPGSADAWNSLGKSFWKKGDLVSARNCFRSSLDCSRAKPALQELSMLLRFMARSGASRGVARSSPPANGSPASDQSRSAAGVRAADLPKVPARDLTPQLSALPRLPPPRCAAGSQAADSPAELINESLAVATDAIALDVSDAQSWYNLGMAHLAHFFVHRATETARLQSALKAFQNSEKRGGEVNPDLHFNRAMVHRYLEEYQLAVEGFARAGELDPSLPWEPEVASIVRGVSRVADLCASKGRLKPKKLQALAEQAAAGPPPKAPWVAATFADLKPGANPGLLVTCRVVVEGTPAGESPIPLYYIMIDAKGDCLALSVFGLKDGTVRSSSLCTLVEPTLGASKLSWKGAAAAEFPLVRVDNVRALLVNGAPVAAASAEPPRLATSSIA